MQTLENGIEVPTNSDPYNLTEDLADAFAAANVVVTVANKTARDALTKWVGRPVYRADSLILETWDGTRWKSGPLGFLGEQTNAGATATGTSQNALVVKTVNLEADRRIEIKALVTARPDTAALYGEYQIYAGGVALRTFIKRYSGVELGESFEFTADHGSGTGGATEFSLQCRVVAPAGTTGLVKSDAFGVKLQIRDQGTI